MRAITFDAYGNPDGLHLVELPRPPVDDDEVLIRVHAASVNHSDEHELSGTSLLARVRSGGLFRPRFKVLGHDLAGVVEEVGSDVADLAPGDEVFGISYRGGTFAELLCAPRSQLRLARKPERLSFAEAAAIPAAAHAARLCLLELGELQPGQHVLINGAAGGIGSFAVQIAKAFGATVTGVCGPAHVEQVHTLGADRVIDYTETDFTREDIHYDLIFDVAAKARFRDCRRVLTDRGIYLTTAFSAPILIRELLSSFARQRLVALPPRPPTDDDLRYLADLVESGTLQPFIGERYPLPATPTALRVISGGHTTGKLVIVMDEAE